MAMQNISIEPLSPVIGAVISGVDLAQSLDNKTFDAVYQALMDHLVIFFRDQDMTLDQQKDFGRRFGKLHIHPAAPKMAEHPEILVIHADENSKHVAGNGWHTDVSCDAEPPMGSILRLTEVPGGGGGDTMFANMYAAYDALSQGMKDYLQKLEAYHSGAHVYAGRYGKNESLRDETLPENLHPIVRTHPVTGKKLIYVNSGFTTRIKGLPRGESKAILGFLYEHVRTPEFHCRFKWQANSIAFWDNRCTQHHALWDYYPESRHGFRVTVAGDRPV